MLLGVLGIVFALCFCIFNYWFQKEKYNRLPKAELEKQNKMNSPGVWLAASVILFLALLGIMSYYIYNYYIFVLKMRM